MSKGNNCGHCAYVDKSGLLLWCPFHDEPVSSKLVCDDFLDEYQSPQWKSLTAGMSEQNSNEKVKQFTGKDITAYILSLFFILLCIACLFVKA